MLFFENSTFVYLDWREGERVEYNKVDLTQNLSIFNQFYSTPFHFLSFFPILSLISPSIQMGP